MRNLFQTQLKLYLLSESLCGHWLKRRIVWLSVADATRLLTRPVECIQTPLERIIAYCYVSTISFLIRYSFQLNFLTPVIKPNNDASKV